MKKRYSLREYSIAATALLVPNMGSSQIVYTDVDPDIILDEFDESFYIDYDGDGFAEFRIQKFELPFTILYYSTIGRRYGFEAGALEEPTNGIIGGTTFLSGGFGWTYHRVWAIDEGDTINNYDHFKSQNFIDMATVRHRLDGLSTPLAFGDFFPFGDTPVENAFVGTKFLHFDGSTHYGWIRCSVYDSVDRLIIHDYAYESKPDIGVIAGDTIGDTTTVDTTVHISTQQLNEIRVIVSNGSFIVLNNNYPLDYQLFNQLGQVIEAGTCNPDQTSINMEQRPKGLYIIHLLDQHMNKRSIKLIY